MANKMDELQKIKLLKEIKELQFDNDRFFCNTQTTNCPDIKCGEFHNGDQYFCKRCFNINYPEILQFCVECKGEFKSVKVQNYEEALCDKCKIEVGRILYGCGYKTRKISFMEDLIIGMKIIKPKIKRITKKYIILNISGDEQRISKDRLGKSIFLTEKEVVEFIIIETKRRISEKINSKRSQHMDGDHLEGMKKDLKKWERFALVSGDENE